MFWRRVLRVTSDTVRRTLRKIALIQRLALLLLLSLSAPASAWWSCDWDYRFAADIARPPGPPVSDYQVRLDLDAASVPAQFDWSLQGADLRVIDEDDLTPLPFFIEQWDAAGQSAVVWVRVPGIAPAGRQVYLYFGAPSGTASASTPTTFTTPGFRFNTRNSGVDPVDRNSAEAAFYAAPASTPGYGCAIVNAYTGINNSGQFSPPSRNRDIGLYAEAFFEVQPADAGTWTFRYGADFGLGGGLYVDDVALDEKWNTDLWWANNWNNTSEILQGTITLTPGYHSLRIIGFEGCCDGGLTVQFRRPGGTFQAMSLANIAMSSRACPAATEPVVTYSGVQPSTCPVVSLTIDVQTVSDPINGTANPKAIPGAAVANIVTVSNAGADPVDANSVLVDQAIPANAMLRVTDFDGTTTGPVLFTDGTPASGLAFSFLGLGNAGDDVAFSNDNAATFNYTPTPGAAGADPNVTHIRINPQGLLNGSTGAGDPTAEFRFKTVVR